MKDYANKDLYKRPSLLSTALWCLVLVVTITLCLNMALTELARV